MKRRDVLKTALAGATTLAAPRIVQAEGAKTITFTPHADLASLDPVWTTADITRNFSLAVYDTLYGYDADFNVQPQMVEGHVISNDGKQWDLTLRDGLAFHDGTPVLGRDCVATIQRFARRDPFGGALMARTDELSAPSDKVIRFRLKKPFSLLPNALGQIYCAIMPERLAKTDAMQQVTEAVGSGPFKFVASERIPGQRVVYEKNDKYAPRKDGKPSFNAGPKIVYIDRVVWNFIPDPATASAALTQGEIDWWENPTIDLVPQLKRDKNLTLTVKDRTGEIGCLRFNHLHPPFDNAAIRRVVVAAMDQKEIMEAVAGAEPSLIKTDVGIFVPGTPMASTVGVEVTRGPKDYNKLKQDLIAAGYKGEKVVILAASTIPTIWAEAQVASDTLKKIGMNTDFQALEWGTVVQRRARSRSTRGVGTSSIRISAASGTSRQRRQFPSRAAARMEAGSAGRPTRRWRNSARPGSMRRMSPRRRRSAKRCRSSSGRARRMLLLACTTPPRGFTITCRTSATAGRSSTV
jgi:peptide/nickel transport system substrate-binding protein